LSLNRLAKRAKEGVRGADGFPMEFGTISVSDGISMGHEGMHYSLVSREIIADSVETVMLAERMDGSVLLAGCDKSLPGMLMAAARLDLVGVRAGPEAQRGMVAERGGLRRPHGRVDVAPDEQQACGRGGQRKRARRVLREPPHEEAKEAGRGAEAAAGPAGSVALQGVPCSPARSPCFCRSRPRCSTHSPRDS
jgi:hypothetical protein